MTAFEWLNWNQYKLIFHFMKRKVFQDNKARAYIFYVLAAEQTESSNKLYFHSVFLSRETLFSHMLIYNLRCITKLWTTAGTQRCWGCETHGTRALLMGCKMLRPLWETAWQVLPTTLYHIQDTYLSYNSEIPLLSFQPGDMKTLMSAHYLYFMSIAAIQNS